MAPKLLATIQGVDIFQEMSGRVAFTADADIDADGANGQNGAIAAYRSDNKGSEHLANGGMRIENGHVVFAADWGRDIVFVNNGRPLVLSNGVIPSRTSYRFKDRSPLDPSAYVDAETVPYAVVSPLIRNAAKGVVLGCRCIMTHLKTGQSVEGVVADIGPRAKIGELSIAAARAIGVPSNPRTGGEDQRVILYEIFPNQPAVVNGVQYDLIPA